MSSFRNFLSSIPPVTKHLIAINLIVWLATMIFPASTVETMMRYGALHYVEATDFNLVQVVTYMFMHSYSGLGHILFNMFALFMFGSVVERTVGSKRFLTFYMICGVGAALVQEIVWAFTLPDNIALTLAALNNTSSEAITQYLNMHPEIWAQNFNVFTTIGASGAIYGILLAFGMMFPNVPLYIMFIPVPVKAKWVVLGYGVLELLLGLSTARDGVAHFAHLGGMLFGFFIILYWKKKFGARGGNVY
ncbi:MAG: rhomboid family intramembrane serine protease [Paramuribaculum sp.]|nr:rhomboid family intramembrane serine protease [Paramuribaculum sp.]